ncbi:MAG TPA: MFS transporter [Acidimicrobiia bacterium]|nr:MFS transporter [Acidimicrobiia bacterium]
MPRRLRRLAVDLSPLRHRDFRLLWLGDLISEAGSQIALVAVFVQVFALTHSPAAVGLVGLVQLVPLGIAALLGGPLIDAVDRRRLLLLAQCGQAGASGLLLAGALLDHPPLAVVYVGAALVAGFGGLALSTRLSMTPNLVPPEQLSSALSLHQVMWNTCLIAGPALGGVIIDRLGLSWAYGIDVASFGAVIGACALMRPQVPMRDGRPDTRPVLTRGWQELTEGLRFLRGRRVLQATFYVDLVAMIFGMPRALFPVLAATQFGGGSETVGLLFAAVGAGALLAALTAGWVRHVHRQGLAVLWAVAVWGLGIIAFGFSGDRLGLALGCLAVAGGADVVSAVFRGTILQQNVPDEIRGRISAVHTLVVVGGPRIGDVEAGLVASTFTPMVSVVSGGVACVAGVILLAALVPQLARYRAPVVPTPAQPTG